MNPKNNLFDLLKSILGLKCPRCRKGNLFIYPGLFRYRNILEMPERCPDCNQKFELEPGFWIGSLWTSYPIVVLIELPFIILAVSENSLNIWLIFTLMALTMLIFYPLIMRLGRSLWIQISIRVKGKSQD